MIKNSPTNAGALRGLDWEDTLEEEMAITMPVFWTGESHGQKNLAGFCPWGHRVGHD